MVIDAGIDAAKPIRAFLPNFHAGCDPSIGFGKAFCNELNVKNQGKCPTAVANAAASAP